MYVASCAEVGGSISKGTDDAVFKFFIREFSPKLVLEDRVRVIVRR